jgi:hypothetical protein
MQEKNEHPHYRQVTLGSVVNERVMLHPDQKDCMKTASPDGKNFSRAKRRLKLLSAVETACLFGTL